MSDASLARPRLQAPEVLDLVEADQVGEQIANTERDLADLEQRATEASNAATRAEDAAQAVNIDTSATTWTIVRLQRFLEDLRAEAERDARAMIDVARHHAQLRVDDARAMAARGERVSTPLVTPVPR